MSEDQSAEKNPATETENKPSEKDKIFDLYEKSVENADWGYKIRSGPERDLGHRSVVLAEKSYIMAALEDREAADKIWEKATGKPPKQDLIERLDKAKKIDPTKGIQNLTAGINSLGERKKNWDLVQEKNVIGDRIANWESTIGDIRKRFKDYRDKALRDLTTAERPDQGDDSGLSLFIKSFKNGISAGSNLSNAYFERKKSKHHGGMIVESEKRLGDIQKEISQFSQKNGIIPDTTNGMLGKSIKKYPGVSKYVMAAVSMMKQKSSGKSSGGILQGEAAKQASMAASQNQGIGM